MSNITTLKNGTLYHPSIMDTGKVYVADNVIDFAEVLTAKGSTIASSDTIECIVVPIGTMIIAAGLQTIAVDDATTLTLDLGFTGGDVDEFVDGYDQAEALAGAYSAQLDTSPINFVIGSTADTIDLLFATLTGTLTVGKVRVWAILADISGSNTRTAGIAAVGS